LVLVEPREREHAEMGEASRQAQPAAGRRACKSLQKRGAEALLVQSNMQVLMRIVQFSRFLT